jgi:hypothetical protein
MLAEDFMSFVPPGIEGIAESVNIVMFEVCGSLDGWYKSQNVCVPGEAYHCWCFALDPAYHVRN